MLPINLDPYVCTARYTPEGVVLCKMTKSTFEAKQKELLLVLITSQEFDMFFAHVVAGGKLGMAQDHVIQIPKDLPDVPPEADIELALREVRNERLRESDWTQVPDSPLAGNKEVLEYRKKLRDVPQEEGFPMVDLPVAPAIIINTL